MHWNQENDDHAVEINSEPPQLLKKELIIVKSQKSSQLFCLDEGPQRDVCLYFT